MDGYGDDRADRRDAKRDKRRHGMRVHGLRGVQIAWDREQRGEVRLSRAEREAARGGRRAAPAR